MIKPEDEDNETVDMLHDDSIKLLLPHLLSTCTRERSIISMFIFEAVKQIHVRLP